MDKDRIDERFLRHVWSRPELRSAFLMTSSGEPVRIIDSGTLNTDGGPDVRGARIRIGGVLFAGDIEIHRNVVEWIQHRHQDDPAYNKVILHVVLEGNPGRFPTMTQSGRRIPVLLLEPFLKESLSTLWQRAVLAEQGWGMNSIPCREKNQGVETNVLTRWIEKLAVERIELKLRRFEERLRELAQERALLLRESWKPYGGLRVEGFPEEIPPLPEPTQKDLSDPAIWMQVLYEGMLDGLGYSKNREPFVRLARLVTLQLVRARKLHADETALHAVLFGVAGLLPRINAMKEKESKTYVRALVRSWNRHRQTLRIGRVHPAEWQFFPTRPGNFPSVRIAAAACLIQKILCEDLFRSIIQCIKTVAAEDAHLQFRMLLRVATGPYWSHHYHFDTPAKRIVNALGDSRIDDIICNTILPICFLYARMFRDLAVREGAMRLFEGFPALSQNSITRQMSEQLLRGKIRLEKMSTQQGVIQLYKYYCTEGRCGECDVGKLVFRA